MTLRGLAGADQQYDGGPFVGSPPTMRSSSVPTGALAARATMTMHFLSSRCVAGVTYCFAHRHRRACRGVMATRAMTVTMIGRVRFKTRPRACRRRGSNCRMILKVMAP